MMFYFKFGHDCFLRSYECVVVIQRAAHVTDILEQIMAWPPKTTSQVGGHNSHKLHDLLFSSRLYHYIPTVRFQTSLLVWRLPLSYNECVPKRYSNESLPKTFKFVLSSGECRQGLNGHSIAMSSPWESQVFFGEVFITIRVSLQRTPRIFF